MPPSPRQQGAPLPDCSVDQYQYTSLFDLDPGFQSYDPYAWPPWAGQDLHAQTATNEDDYSLTTALTGTDANIDDWGEFNHSYLNPPSTTLDPVIDPAVGWNPVIDPAVGWTRPEEIASGHGPQWEQPDPICNPMIEPVKTSSSGSVEHNQYQEYENIVVCPECQATFDNGFKSLEDHARSSRHRCFTCRYTGCGLAFYLTNELISHESTHTDHARIVPTLPNTCPECQDHFGTARELDAHCNKHQHRFYACKCGSVFSRSDVLARHLNRYHPTMPKYPCLHCNRHRGYDGFRRRDHLTQHLQGYHHRQTDQSIRPLGDYFSRCPYPECPKYITSAMTISQRRGEYPPCFESQAHFTKHMRETHDESLFPCKVPYCIKVGGKGYARERDLINHHKNLHPEAPPYVVADFSCIEQNCREVLYSPNRFQLAWHYVEYHGYEGEDARRMVGMNS